MDFLAFAILLLTLVITVAVGVFFYAAYLLLKRITAIPVDFKLPEVTAPALPVGDGKLPADGDRYTPESADRTLPLEQFRPRRDKPLKVVFDEADQVTPVDEGANGQK